MSLLSIEQWRSLIGFNPFHFWGLSNSTVPVSSACNTTVHKHAWQSADACGRDELKDAIETAEAKLTAWLGYAPMPHYTTETLAWPQYPDRRIWRLGWADGTSHWISVQLREGWIDAIGIFRQTLLGNVAVVYSDSDGDGLNDTFTTSIVTTVTDPNQIKVYFAAADRLDSDGAVETWQVRPVRVSISGGTATITGKSWMLVKPVLHEGVSPAGINPATATNFVTTLDIYREYIDPDGITNNDAQGVLIWETMPYPQWVTFSVPPDNSRDPASLAYAIARVGIRDAEIGLVHAAKSEYDAATGQFSVAGWTDYVHRPPDKVVIRYRAGYPLENASGNQAYDPISGPSTINGQMTKKFQVILARMAAAELVRPICACDTANRELYRWQFDMARSAGVNDEQYQIATEDLNNPFGTRAGHVYAWKEVRHLRNFQGILAG